MFPSAAAVLRDYSQRACSIPSLQGLMGVDSAFLALVTLTFDLDIQTRQSQGPNTSSV